MFSIGHKRAFKALDGDSWGPPGTNPGTQGGSLLWIPGAPRIEVPAEKFAEFLYALW